MRDADRDKLKANLAAVEERIAAACARAGRKRSEVTLVGVTKYVDVDVARALLELGVRDLGESRPQELWRKAAAIPEARWHLVGHLQRNKVERTLPLARLIHSVDSIRLLDAVDADAKSREVAANLLLEFNVSGDESKYGFLEADLEKLVARFREPIYSQVRGLMTMGPLAATPEENRAVFASLRQMRDLLRNIRQRHHSMSHLSMGMTNDFEIAIEEGATLVRIGSALFEGLETRTT